MLLFFLSVLCHRIDCRVQRQCRVGSFRCYWPEHGRKEVRFGPGLSALFTAITTAFTTGTVNNMHDTLTPIGGLVPIVLMMLNAIFGGEGVGLMNMLIYVLLTVFICSLMVGKTPHYLGMKIEGREMKLIALTF